MKITKEMIDRKKFDVTRPDEFREHLAKTCFPKGMEKYGLDYYSMDEIAYFYADMRIHAMSADCIEHLRGEYPCLTESRYPWPEKGLFIFGPSGTGKTTIAEVLAERFGMEFYTSSDLVFRYMANQGDDWYADFYDSVSNKPIVIDDLAAEREVRKYGNESIIIDLIMAREQTHRRFGTPTIFTSNLAGSNEIRDRYGDRVLSRIIGMCNIVMLTGNDRRRGK